MNNDSTVSVDTAQLSREGFVGSGTAQFEKSVLDYASELKRVSFSLADASKAEGFGREVTHDHVSFAAQRLSTVGKKISKRPLMFILMERSLFLFGAAAGYILTLHPIPIWGVLVMIVGGAIFLINFFEPLIRSGDTA